MLFRVSQSAKFRHCQVIRIVRKSDPYQFARVLRWPPVMMKLDSAVPDTDRLLELLESILTLYKDGDSRPEQSLSLYRQCLRLSMNYRVRLAKRFVVIEGGVRRKRPSSPLGSIRWHARPRLRLAPKPHAGTALP